METKRYTAFVKWDKGRYAGNIEEIDVDAYTRDEARSMALAELRAMFEPGGKIIEVRERIGWYM